MGKDKAFLSIKGKPFAYQLYEQLNRLSQQVYIAANQLQAQLENQCSEAVFINDTFKGHEGPLSGILPALQKSSADYLWVTPVDCFGDLSTIQNALLEGLRKNQSDILFLSIEGKDQPLLSLIKTSLKDNLATYLQQGNRAVFRWFLTQDHCVIKWQNKQIFAANINTPDELARVTARQSGRSAF